MVMAEDIDPLQRELVARIEARRAAVRAYLRDNRPRLRRRSNLTVVLSALAAVFTVGPAVGGETFAGGVQRTLGLSTDSIVWRVLCLAALLVSVTAAVLTNLTRAQDTVGRLSTVEAAGAELEGLMTLLEFGQLAVPDAVRLYQQYAEKISFLDDVPAGTATAAA
jgi:hypothetical protein